MSLYKLASVLQTLNLITFLNQISQYRSRDLYEFKCTDDSDTESGKEREKDSDTESEVGNNDNEHNV